MIKKAENEAEAARRVIKKFSRYMACSICPYDQKCEIKNDPDLCPTKCMKYIIETAKREIAEEKKQRTSASQ